MAKRTAEKKKHILFLRIILLLVGITLLAGLFVVYLYKKQLAEHTIAEVIEEEPPFVFNLAPFVQDNATIDTYYTYGTSFHLSGSLKVDPSVIVDSIDLILCPKDDPIYSGAVLEMPLEYAYTGEADSIAFNCSSYINEGLCLENIAPGDYVFLIILSDTYGRQIPYSLSDFSKEDSIVYYTLTRNNENNCISINSKLDDAVPYMELVCKPSVLPDDVYDIVLDPGHGGNDGGAVSKGEKYIESEMTLMYALGLKKLFEEKGYKVFLTRDGSEDDDEPMAYTMYDEDGRINIACASKAKLAFSIHLNSDSPLLNGGLQIYHSSRTNNTFACLLADTIVDASSLDYSDMASYQETDGVYSRAYLESEIAESDSYAIKHNFEPYTDLDTTTDYYYIIRELGGIATDAHADGRNKNYGENLYRDANYGIETYLCELGYISENRDLKILLDEQDTIQEALVDAVCTHIEDLYETQERPNEAPTDDIDSDTTDSENN